jgi:hypothetical protein
MIGFDELNILPDAVVILFEKYQTSVILDIARRLARLPYLSRTAAWQMARLTQSGGVYDFALDQLERTTGMARSELVDAFKKAGVRTLNYDNNLYKLAGFKPINLNLSPAMMRVLQSGFEKTFGAMINLTRTTALQSEQLFIEASDLAYQQIVTGAFDYNSAIKQAVIDVAEQGVHTVSYPSGRKHQLDVAVRRAVLTGVGQTAAGVQLINIGEMGTDLVQVSAHIGARNVGEGPKNHESWQGEIYSISGDHKKYGSFLEITGYGTGEGLHGWNCRHNYYPWFEGISVPGPVDPKDYKGKTVKYKGEQIDYYKATQIQRGIERAIRKEKRVALALGAADLDHRIYNQKIRWLQAKMREFIRETGLDRHREREQVRY